MYSVKLGLQRVYTGLVFRGEYIDITIQTFIHVRTGEYSKYSDSTRHHLLVIQLVVVIVGGW